MKILKYALYAVIVLYFLNPELFNAIFGKQIQAGRYGEAGSTNTPTV